MKRSQNNKQDTAYGYESTYSTYYPNTPSPSVANQPLPGQPPLPPMPPPAGALPPLPHVFPAMPPLTQMQTWAHAAPTWQWITPGQATALAAQSTRDMANNVARGNYNRRDRFVHNRNNVYPQRGNNFHRKNRRTRYDQPHNQFDPTAYYGQSLPGAIGIDWQRAGFTAAGQADGLLNHIPVSSSLPTNVHVEKQDGGDQEVKIVSVRFFFVY